MAPSPSWPTAIEALVPGGIKPTDHWHIKTNDDTCSRCRKEVPDEHVPLMLFRGQHGEDMLIYCEDCLAKSEGEAQ
jgi:hypothetical protein